MESPVIYFYGDQSEHLSVNVKFPEGVISESFPGPVATFPAKSDDPVIANGNTTFEVNISPRTTGTLPPVSRDNIYSHAREVASNIVSSVATNDQTQVKNEKFIFYRGLGRFQPKLNISSSEGALSIRSERELPIAFLVHVNSSGDGQLLSVLGKNEATLSSARISELQDHSAIHAGIYRG